MKLSETRDEGLRKSRLEYIASRWKDLAEMYRQHANEAWRYLFLVNSGGAIATLSLMGAMKSFAPFPGARVMLGLFLLGMVLVGIGRAAATYRTHYIWDGFRKDVKQYYVDEIGWAELSAKDADRTRYFLWTDIIGWSSFLCFVGGLAIGTFNLWRV